MAKHQSKFWVADSSEYGFGVTFYNTDNWTEKDFDRIEDAYPDDRLHVANAIDAKRKKERLLAKRFIQAVEQVEVRHFVIDDDGVVELDPETGDEL